MRHDMSRLQPSTRLRLRMFPQPAEALSVARIKSDDDAHAHDPPAEDFPIAIGVSA